MAAMACPLPQQQAQKEEEMVNLMRCLRRERQQRRDRCRLLRGCLLQHLEQRLMQQLLTLLLQDDAGNHVGEFETLQLGLGRRVSDQTETGAVDLR